MENTKYTEEFKQIIVSLYESGKSSTQICKEYGMSSSTLHKWIKKYTKVQIGAILKKWTAKSERWYNNKKRRETHGKHQVYRGIQAKHSKLV